LGRVSPKARATVNSFVPERFNSPVKATIPGFVELDHLVVFNQIGVAVAGFDVATGEPPEAARSAERQPAIVFFGDEQFAAGNLDHKGIVRRPEPSRCVAQSR
jgi:hypothetical protein